MSLRSLLILMYVLLLTPAGATGAAGTTTAGSHPPATIENPTKESDLTTVRLQPEAEARLGIKTAPVRLEDIRLTETYGGEAITPHGRSMILSAPMTGTVTTAQTITAPVPGMRVAKGQPLLDLVPSVGKDREVLTPSERVGLAKARADLESAKIQALGEENEAKVQLEAAKIKLDRATQLRQRDVGSVKAVDEAQAEYRLSEVRFKSAQARLEVLRATVIDLGKDDLPILGLTAPFEGIIQDLYVSPHQSVPSGSPMLRVVAVNPLWIRVPVYAGDIGRIDPAAQAEVFGLADPAGSPARIAKPVMAPPSGNPLASTIDTFYEIDNSDGGLRAGQRVKVVLRTAGTGKCRTIPWSAVLYDVHGGTWVYENSRPQTFVRRRVEVGRVLDGRAIMMRGPSVGTKVVEAGAAELFGIEFGGSK